MTFFEPGRLKKMNIKSPLYSDGLNGACVFLSASFPYGERANKFPNADPFEITDAVVALARSIFGAGGKLVFGGHPTISPLVLSVGRDFKSYYSKRDLSLLLPLVYIYQSRYFNGEIPFETLQLEREGIGKIIWVESESNQEQSLGKMRLNMLIEQKPIAGVFIGGMAGVYDAQTKNDEFHIFVKICKGKPIYPIGKTGGASQDLLKYYWNNQKLLKELNYSIVSPEELSNPASFSILTKKIVIDIIHHKQISSKNE